MQNFHTLVTCLYSCRVAKWHIIIFNYNKVINILLLVYHHFSHYCSVSAWSLLVEWERKGIWFDVTLPIVLELLARISWLRQIKSGSEVTEMHFLFDVVIICPSEMLDFSSEPLSSIKWSACI